MPQGWVVEAVTRRAGTTLIMREKFSVAIANEREARAAVERIADGTDDLFNADRAIAVRIRAVTERSLRCRDRDQSCDFVDRDVSVGATISDAERGGWLHEGRRSPESSQPNDETQGSKILPGRHVAKV